MASRRLHHLCGQAPHIGMRHAHVCPVPAVNLPGLTPDRVQHGQGGARR
eukprot:COSAG01_NODE_741_length_13888_cov_119.430996_7_plen_49_part_00